MGGTPYAERKKREKEVRKMKANERRFNEALYLYIQHKYPEIFKEYTELYKRVDDENPKRKHLATSETFKNWLLANPLNKPTNQATTSSGTIPFTGQLLVPRLALEPMQTPPKDIITTAFEETIAPPNTTNPIYPQPSEWPDIVPVDEIINEINEWMENNDLQNGDEGIELNRFEEIMMDIEPFDFELEVERYDF